MPSGNITRRTLDASFSAAVFAVAKRNVDVLSYGNPSAVEDIPSVPSYFARYLPKCGSRRGCRGCSEADYGCVNDDETISQHQ